MVTRSTYKLQTFVAIPITKSIEDVFERGNRQFKKIEAKHRVQIGKDPQVPEVMLVTGSDRFNLDQAVHSVHDAIRAQADPRTGFLVQPPSDALPAADAFIREKYPGSRAEGIASKKVHSKPSQAATDSPPSELTREFNVEIRRHLDEMTTSIVQGGNRGTFRTRFGHLTLPLSQRIRPTYSHNDFYTLVMKLGDRGGIDSFIRTPKVIASVFSIQQGTRTTVVEEHDVLLSVGDTELVVALENEEDDDYDDEPTPRKPGASVTNWSNTIVSPRGIMRRKTDKDKSAHIEMTVICPQRYFDWMIETVQPDEHNIKIPENAKALQKTLKLTGGTRKDEWGPYPPIYIQASPRAYKPEYTVLRSSRNMRIGNSRYQLWATLNRHWRGANTRVDPDVTCDLAILPDAVAADAYMPRAGGDDYDVQRGLGLLLPGSGDESGGTEGFVRAIELAQEMLNEASRRSSKGGNPGKGSK